MSKIRAFFIALLNGLGVYRTTFAFYQSARYAFDFRLREKNRRWIEQGAPDGLPIPPPRLINLVAGHFDAAAFYQNGRLGADCIEDILKKNGIEMSRLFSVLDFGCGCGRVLRFWHKMTGPKIHGCDYNRKLVRWCRLHLPFGEFSVNKLNPPLSYRAETFGLIYAISVFTHLNEELQIPWMRELYRICRPGGFVLLSVHGKNYLDQIPEKERNKFNAGELAIIREEYAGTNICGVFHPETYVRNVLAQGFRVVEFLPRGAKDADQDLVLLQRPSLS